MTPPPPGFFTQPIVVLARTLVGCTLLVDGIGGTIVETEAYARDDPAAHSFGGRTPRNAAMFGPPECAYVYRSYGLHWCLNVVGGDQPGEAVLIRALEPTHGVATMVERRGLGDPRLLCAGPGRLCQALAITGALDGCRLDAAPFGLAEGDPAGPVVAGSRIGISKAADLPWRFALAGSPFLSRPAPRQARAPASLPRPTGRSSPRE